jgi:hypothetical protein
MDLAARSTWEPSGALSDPAGRPAVRIALRLIGPA